MFRGLKKKNEESGCPHKNILFLEHVAIEWQAGKGFT